MINGLREKHGLRELLSDPVNRSILTLCSEKPRRPTELAEILNRTRVAIDKRAKPLLEENLLTSFRDEKGRKYYQTTSKGRWCIENYPQILEKKETKIYKEHTFISLRKTFNRLSSKISPAKIIALFLVIIGFQGFFKFAVYENSFERGTVVLLFWIAMASLTYVILKKITS